MKSFSLALLAAGAQALNTSTVAAPSITVSQPKLTASSASAATLSWGWSGTTAYFRPGLQVKGNGDGTSEEYEIAFPIMYNNAKVAHAMCHFTAMSTTYAVEVSVYDWAGAWTFGTTVAADTLMSTKSGTNRSATIATTGVTQAVAISGLTENAQSGGSDGNWVVAATSSATFT
jgi:hypothetical protein